MLEVKSGGTPPPAASEPVGELEGEADPQAAAVQRCGKEALRALNPVEDRVAVREQGTGRARGAELLADIDAQRVPQLRVGRGESAEGARHELRGALAVRGGERDDLDVGERG